MRSPSGDELAHISDVLRRLRAHFPKTWPGCAEGFEHDLMGFAYYEGCGHRWECCRGLLAEAAPFAVGQDLVLSHGFRWVMLGGGRAWRYGVAHPALENPIDLASLEDGSWLEEELLAALHEAGPPDPGRTTLESLPAIIEQVSRLGGKSEPATQDEA